MFDESCIEWEKIDAELLHVGYILLLDALDQEEICSGVLYGAWKKWSLEESIQLGNCAAAVSLSDMTATEGMQSLEEVMGLAMKYHT